MAGRDARGSRGRPDASGGTGPPVVALVASAGGLDAITAVLAPLPADLPAAIVVLQHTSPDHRSLLSEILTGRTALPVRTAHTGDRLEAGLVLTAPSAAHTLIAPGGVVRLIPSGDWPPYRPSADLLLTTLALTVERRAIAVVLSGKGTDAATGATAIHHCGGLVLASDAATSEEFAMPHAVITRDHALDQVLPLDAIAPLLISTVATRTTPPAHTAPPGP